MSLTTQETALLARLDAAISSPDAITWLEGAADRLTHALTLDRDCNIAFEVVPSSVLAPIPPTESAWVFILRRGRFSGAERHPNSTQRMVAFRGNGVFQTWIGGRWVDSPLAPHEGEIERRWISIPPNVWHQSAPPVEDWVVVSFHTVPAHELIEERGDPGADAIHSSAFYLEGSHR